MKKIYTVISRSFFSKKSSSDGFLSASTPYAEAMYEAYLKDPKSVHVSWQAYFASMKQSSGQFQPPPSLGGEILTPSLDIAAGPNVDVTDHLKIQQLVRGYQVRGHQLANLDPLGINFPKEFTPELSLSYYGFTEADYDRTFYLGNGILPGFKSQTSRLTLREIEKSLKDIYCGTIGIEYGHIPSRQMCDWLRERVEVPRRHNYSKETKKVILDRLMWGDMFEKFVSSKWSSEKRFGLEGCESLIPGMKALIDQCVVNGVDRIVMGMPHRGRLNVLSNVVRKPNESIFAEFSGSLEPGLESSGDVKYHLGMNYNRPTLSGKNIYLSLCANPSHLEAVNPVVAGKVRAHQYLDNDEDREKSLSVLLHGDAAFAAQGVVYETLGFMDLPK
jgi:2-oxoglutarate dehydrogenase E1 component